MSLYDFIIRNGTLVTPNGINQDDLAINDGRIVAIAPTLAAPNHFSAGQARQTIVGTTARARNSRAALR